MLEAIRARLVGRGSGHVVSVTGIGGVGKTQPVVEYAYAERNTYDVIWWVRAQPLAMALADLAALVADPRLPDPPQLSALASAEDRLAAARDWLERHDRCLLIVDNVDDPAAVRPLLPRAGGGHVLLTARSDVDWADWAMPLPLDMLEPDDASRFLRHRSGDPDEAAAAALATELGRLPLALEQAASYISETGGLTLAGYLALFQVRSRELLGRGRPVGRDDTVNMTWSLSLDRLTEASPSAVDLLTVSAFLAADDISISLLTEQASELPSRLAETITDPLVLADTIGVLRRYGLAKAAADAIIVHRLLQAVIRNNLDEDTQRRWAGFALATVTAGFPDDWEDPLVWPQCQRLVSHALAATGHAERLAVDLAAVSLLLDRAGRYLRRRGQYGPEAELLRRVLALDERIQRDDATLWISHNNLGEVLRQLGDLRGARAKLARAIELGERTLGPDHPNLVAPHSNLGEVLRQLEDLPGARAELIRAIGLGERALGPDHPADFAMLLYRLGTLEEDIGDLQSAQASLTRAVSMDERAYGPDHKVVSADLETLAHIQEQLGDLRGATASLLRALEIRQRNDGTDWPRAVELRDRLYELGART
jgi:tetratricopeptide (TPR) repeat protein